MRMPSLTTDWRQCYLGHSIPLNMSTDVLEIGVGPSLGEGINRRAEKTILVDVRGLFFWYLLVSRV